MRVYRGKDESRTSAAFSVSRCLTEVGIRLAMGAAARDVLTLALGQGMKQIAIDTQGDRNRGVSPLARNEPVVLVRSGPGGASRTPAALARDEEVQSTFADGILRVTVGRQPEPIACPGISSARSAKSS